VNSAEIIELSALVIERARAQRFLTVLRSKQGPEQPDALDAAVGRLGRLQPDNPGSLRRPLLGNTIVSSRDGCETAPPAGRVGAVFSPEITERS